MRPPCDVLWCSRSKPSGRDGWSWPAAVRDLIVAECEGMTVLHLFGGRADFGVRMDIDPSTRPHVIADAWLPPFAEGSFDVVTLDPPYVGGFSSMSSQLVTSLVANAAWIARKRVVWFHQIWIESPARCKMERSWLVRVGRSCNVRTLQFFKPPDLARKLRPADHFVRGPAIKYNRWLLKNMLLPFGEPAPSDVTP